MNWSQIIQRKIAERYLERNPKIAVDFLQKRNRVSLAKIELDELEQIKGFEDLGWLFTSNKANRGILRLSIKEAATLYKLVNSLNNPEIFELGRFEGGSTVLIASAMRGGFFTSVDISPKNDKFLIEVLERLKLKEKVNLVISDANKLVPVAKSYDMVFIDGDHSYKAAKRDYEHWKNTVKPGGYLIFHDYDEVSAPGVVKVCNEIKKIMQFKEEGVVDTLIVFKRAQ